MNAQQLQEAGFSQDEINSYLKIKPSLNVDQLKNAGFSDEEIKDYVKRLEPSPLREKDVKVSPKIEPFFWPAETPLPTQVGVEKGISEVKEPEVSVLPLTPPPSVVTPLPLEVVTSPLPSPVVTPLPSQVVAPPPQTVVSDLQKKWIEEPVEKRIVHKISVMERIKEIAELYPELKPKEVKKMISGEYTPGEITTFGREYFKSSLVGERKKVSKEVEPKRTPSPTPLTPPKPVPSMGVGPEWEFIIPPGVKKDWEPFIKPSNVAAIPLGKPELAPSHIQYQSKQEGITSLLTSGFRQLWTGVKAGTSSFYDFLDKSADLISKATGMEKGGLFKNLAENIKPSDIELGEGGIIGKINQAIGALPGTLLKYVLPSTVLGPMGGFAATEAIEASPGGVVEAAKGALKGAAMGGILKAVQPLSPSLRIPAIAGLFGGQAAIEGAPVEDVIASTILGGGLGVPGGKGMPLREAIRRPIPTVTPTMRPVVIPGTIVPERPFTEKPVITEPTPVQRYDFSEHYHRQKVNAIKERIRAGEKPEVTTRPGDIEGEIIATDGLHTLQAYKELGIKPNYKFIEVTPEAKVEAPITPKVLEAKVEGVKPTKPLPEEKVLKEGIPVSKERIPAPNILNQKIDRLVSWIESNNLKEKIGIKGNIIDWINDQTSRTKMEGVREGKNWRKIRGTSIETLSQKGLFGDSENGESLRKDLLEITRIRQGKEVKPTEPLVEEKVSKEAVLVSEGIPEKVVSGVEGKEVPNIQKFLERLGYRLASEQKGQAILDDMAERKISPQNENALFWEKTYPKLNDEQKRFVNKYIQSLTATKPGGVLGIDAQGKQIIAKDWMDIGKDLDLGHKAEFLEGTERGYVAIIRAANEKLGGPGPEAKRIEVLKEVISVSEEGVKQPWEMTQEEFVSSKGGRPEWAKAGLGEIGKAHRRSIEKALSEGKLVPPEVLKDYPDLVKKEVTEAIPKPISVKPEATVEGVKIKTIGLEKIKKVEEREDILSWIRSKGGINSDTVSADIFELTQKQSGFKGKSSLVRKGGRGLDVLRDEAEWEGIILPGTTTDELGEMLKDAVRSKKAGIERTLGPGSTEKEINRYIQKMEEEYYRDQIYNEDPNLGKEETFKNLTESIDDQIADLKNERIKKDGYSKSELDTEERRAIQAIESETPPPAAEIEKELSNFFSAKATEPTKELAPSPKQELKKWLGKTAASYDAHFDSKKPFNIEVKGYVPGGEKATSWPLVPPKEEVKYPKVLYHGTSKEIKTFRPSEGGAAGPGIYLAEKPEKASVFAGKEGGRVYPVYTNVKNPLLIKAEDRIHVVELNRYARNNGYDSLYIPSEGEWIIFDSSNIRFKYEGIGAEKPSPLPSPTRKGEQLLPGMKVGLEQPKGEAVTPTLEGTPLGEAARKVEVERVQPKLGLGKPKEPFYPISKPQNVGQTTLELINIPIGGRINFGETVGGYEKTEKGWRPAGTNDRPIASQFLAKKIEQETIPEVVKK